MRGLGNIAGYAVNMLRGRHRAVQGRMISARPECGAAELARRRAFRRDQSRPRCPSENPAQLLLLSGTIAWRDFGDTARPIDSRPGCMEPALFRLFPCSGAHRALFSCQTGQKPPLLFITVCMCYTVADCSITGCKDDYFPHEAGWASAQFALLFSRKQGKQGKNPSSRTPPVVRKAAECARLSGQRESAGSSPCS